MEEMRKLPCTKCGELISAEYDDLSATHASHGECSKALQAEVKRLRAELEAEKEKRKQAEANMMPPQGSPLLELGVRLTELLDDDQWNEIEPMLFGVRAATEAESFLLRDVISCALEWIDAVPKGIPLPAMPGFDRDWADNVLSTLPDRTTKLRKLVEAVRAWAKTWKRPDGTSFISLGNLEERKLYAALRKLDEEVE